MLNRSLEYTDGETNFKGILVLPDASTQKRPVVLVVHDWSGCNHFAHNNAEKLAQLGYIGFAIDMYGNGVVGKTKEEKMQLIAPLKENRSLLKKRILAAVEAAKKIPEADVEKIAAIGFCFGGLCVLDLARSGAPVTGVVSFHGLLDAPTSSVATPISAKVLVLHGYDDPMAPPAEAISFANEMTQAKADWQMHMYGSTVHAFANPEADDPAFGTVYSAQAAQRSWLATKNFLQEIFK